ncbi:MAG: N-acetylglucosamine-6-phosphate deacetylase, partial [Fidelibacterota bacterium]
MSRLILKNCQLYNQPIGGLTNISIADGRIVAVGDELTEGATNGIDVGGQIVSPGFIDIHIQGAGGCDILDGSVESLKIMSRTLARYGVTGFLATTVMNPKHRNAHLKVLAEHWQDDFGGARILGLHLEGPFINPAKRGGIAESAIYPASGKAADEIFGITGNCLKMMTVAPELKGSRELIDRLQAHGCIPSLGHTAVNYHQTKKAFDWGIRHVTHVFNAMPPLHHREPGPLLAILDSGEVSVQVISDGVHLHPDIVRFLAQSLGIGRCICITDGIQAIGLPEGRYEYNGREYLSQDGVACYDDGTLIGTALALNEIGARFKKFTACSLEEAVDSVSLNPARLLGLDRCKGRLAPGMDADLVVMD